MSTGTGGLGERRWGRLQEALDHAPALVAVTHGPDHVVTYVNEAYAAVFGERALSRPGRDVYPELVEQGFFALMDGVYGSGQPYSVRAAPLHVARPDIPGGRPATPERGYFTLVYAPLHDDDGAVEGILVVGIDVTQQVLVSDRLRASERQQRNTALTLQRGLLSSTLYQPDELDIAARYLPASDEAEVGGDWYDVIPLGAGRTALVMGDVMGHGVRAAAVMGQLRTAVRAYARLDLPPDEILELLDGLVSEMSETEIVTCVYAVHDPAEQQLNYACAGHPPALLLQPEGQVRHLTRHGAALGALGGTYEHATCAFPPGALLALYTDGLIERRGENLDVSIARLAEALRSVLRTARRSGIGDSVRAEAALDAGCDAVFARLGVGSPEDGHSRGDDDAALLLAYTPRMPPGAEGMTQYVHEITMQLVGGQQAAQRARAFAHGVLSAWRLPPLRREDIQLVVSELVANAVVHAREPMRLRLRHTTRHLIVEVFDSDEHLPRRRQADREAEGGRGLQLVARLADRWGARRIRWEGRSGKAVWCEFDIAPAMPAAHAV